MSMLSVYWLSMRFSYRLKLAVELGFQVVRHMKALLLALECRSCTGAILVQLNKYLAKMNSTDCTAHFMNLSGTKWGLKQLVVFMAASCNLLVNIFHCAHKSEQLALHYMLQYMLRLYKTQPRLTLAPRN